jgi:UDP-N-acetyl-D-mannosaminuronic acid dehydrogenase
MSIEELQQKIEAKTAKVAVIGLGYVGLPVAATFAEAGYDVVGVDIRPELVEKINQGINPIEGKEPGLAEILKRAAESQRLRASTQYKILQDRDIILIAVETPVDEDNVPRYQALRAAIYALRNVLKTGSLVIIESTIAPGTMQAVVQPALEENGRLRLNESYYLGNCPERVMPGRLLENLRTMSRVVGGMTPETAQVMVAFYRQIVQADLDPVDCVTAELVKTIENTYRDVQIAFANEIALICEAVGGDVWKVRQLVNKSPGRQMLLPGIGVGGHCIPKDPWLLAYGVHDKELPLRLIPAARAVNEAMPRHMADLVQAALAKERRPIFEARILILGYAYLEDSDDTRNSPSQALANYLGERGAHVLIQDPFVPGYQSDWRLLAQGCDAAILAVKHQDYLHLDLKKLASLLRTPILVDGRGFLNPDQVRKAGLVYWGIGQGQ